MHPILSSVKRLIVYLAVWVPIVGLLALATRESLAVIAPAVYWTSHFALLGAGYGVRWEPEIWLGSVVWACLSGLTLALLMWPPAVPLTAWNRGRAASRRPATPTQMPARMVGR